MSAYRKRVAKYENERHGDHKRGRSHQRAGECIRPAACQTGRRIGADILDKKKRHELWEYQGRKIQSVGLNAVAGGCAKNTACNRQHSISCERVLGCRCAHGRHERQWHGGVAQLSELRGHLMAVYFISAPDKIAGGSFNMRAYNDWHIDEWCGAHPGRFIPLGHSAAVGSRRRPPKEVKRLADQGLPCRHHERQPDDAKAAQHP